MPGWSQTGSRRLLRTGLVQWHEGREGTTTKLLRAAGSLEGLSLWDEGCSGSECEVLGGVVLLSVQRLIHLTLAASHKVVRRVSRCVAQVVVQRTLFSFLVAR